MNITTPTRSAALGAFAVQAEAARARQAHEETRLRLASLRAELRQRETARDITATAYALARAKGMEVGP